MAEFVFRDLAEKRGVKDRFYTASKATSREELGNPVYPPVRDLLAAKGISCEGKTAELLEPRDYDLYDYIIGMEETNVRNILRIFPGDHEGKVHRLLDFSDQPRDIADPWYTGNFQKAYDDILEGCLALMNYIEGSMK